MSTVAALVAKLPALSEPAEKWCRAYLEHGNARKAAMSLGYDYNTASAIGARYRRDPKCREWLAIADEQGTLAAIRKRKDLRKRLLRNDALAIEGYPITDRNGRTVGTKRDITASNRALELLGKLDGLLVDRLEHSGSIDLLGSIRAAYAEHTQRAGVVDGGKLESISEDDKAQARKALAEFWDRPDTTDKGA